MLKDFIWISVILALLFGSFINVRPLAVPDEGRYTEIPREMIASGDYITPRLNHIKYFEKPPLLYWIEAGSLKLFGVHEWAARAPIALIALLGCLMVYWAGLTLYNRRTGILSCFILATSLLYFGMARFVITDMLLSVCITATLLLFLLGVHEPILTRKRYYFWGMYVCAALAVLTKGLIGVILPGMVIFLWLCLTHHWKQLKTFCLPTGILLFLIVAAPWHILVQLENPEFFHFYIVEQQFLRYFTDYAGRQQDAWFFPVVTFGGFFPWICFLLACPLSLCFAKQRAKLLPWLVRCWRKRHVHQTTIFLVLWTLAMFAFFSLSESLLIPYALPIMPALGLLVGKYLGDQLVENNSQYKHPLPKKVEVNIAFLLIALSSIIIGIGGILALPIFAPHPTFLVYACILFTAISLLFSALVYWRYSLLAGTVALMITMVMSFITIDLAYPEVDTRSIKPLALIIQAQLKPDTEIVSYHGYYQDLPAYLGRRVTLVGYQGELAFGIANQDARDWVLDEKTFWQRWYTQPGMFMIMQIKDFIAAKQQHKNLYPVAHTKRNVLVGNTK